MSLSQLSLPEGARLTLGDGIGFVALVDRMQVDHALKVVNRHSLRSMSIRLDGPPRVSATSFEDRARLDHGDAGLGRTLVLVWE